MQAQSNQGSGDDNLKIITQEVLRGIGNYANLKIQALLFMQCKQLLHCAWVSIPEDGTPHKYFTHIPEFHNNLHSICRTITRCY